MQKNQELDDELYQALIQGKLWAATLAVGDTFEGCQPESVKRYPEDTEKQRMFIDGSLDVLLRTNIYIEDNGTITKIEREN